MCTDRYVRLYEQVQLAGVRVEQPMRRASGPRRSAPPGSVRHPTRFYIASFTPRCSRTQLTPAFTESALMGLIVKYWNGRSATLAAAVAALSVRGEPVASGTPDRGENAQPDP